MRLTYEESAALLSKFWSGQPVPSPKTGRPMRAFFVDRSFNPQVVMIGGAGEHLRFDQKPRQIEFSAGHIKSMVRDAKERENPVCPQDFEPLVVSRTSPTWLSVRLAEAWGIAVCGYTRARQTNIYAHSERIVLDVLSEEWRDGEKEEVVFEEE